MEIKLTKEESKEFFYNSLCNGLEYFDMVCELSIQYHKDEYRNAKALLEKEKPNNAVCFEDVLMRILEDGGSLFVRDSDADADFVVKMEQVLERVEKSPTLDLWAMAQEQDDASTALNILQTVFFEDIVYG